MVVSTINFIINSGIILLIIYCFNIIGQVINNKYMGAKFQYSIPIGFGAFIASFQLLSFPYIMVQTKFSMFLVGYAIFMSGWVIFIILNRMHVKSWKINLKQPLTIIVLVIIAAIIMLRSTVYSDSWLYSAMITSTVENNLIYSNNGLLANVQLSIMHHRFEAYYLWQAVVAVGFVGDYLLALVTQYKIFDAFLFVFTFLEMGYQFKFSKIKSIVYTFAMFVMLVAAGSFLDISPFQTTEPPVQLFQISTGTALYHYYIIPYTIMYLQLSKTLSYRQRNYYLLGMLVTYSSLSTTYYYTLPLFYITLLTISHLIERKKDNQVLLAFFGCWYFIFLSFLGVYTQSITYCLLYSVIYVCIVKVIMIIYKKMSIKQIIIISVAMVSAYILIAIAAFNPGIYNTQDFLTDKLLLRISNQIVDWKNGNYVNVILPCLYLIFNFLMLSIIFFKAKYQVFMQYIIVYSLYFLNPFAIMLYRVIGIQPVISRIFAYTFIGYLTVICCFDLIRFTYVKVVLTIWLAIASVEVVSEIPGDMSLKKTQKHAIETKMNGLASYDFAPNSFIVFDNLNATIGSEVYYTGINKLVVLNPSISWDPDIYSCEQLQKTEKYEGEFDHCYTIYGKAKAEDLNYEYETDKHLVYQNY